MPTAEHPDAVRADLAPPRGSLPRYRSTLSYGWVLGDFPVRELLTHAPTAALEVRWHGALPADRKARLEAACAAAGVPFRRDDAAVEAKRSKGTARVLACFAKGTAPLSTTRDHLVLVAPSDPGNLGTTLRSALAFGVEDVAVVASGDPWSPHVTRASLGAAFALRIATFPDLAAYRRTVPGHDLWRLDGQADTLLEEVRPGRRPVAVIAGPEWPGDRTATGCAIGATTAGGTDRATVRSVGIAMDERVESLNVGVAVGIALHHLRTARRVRP